MSLIARIGGLSGETLSPHETTAVIVEFVLGRITSAATAYAALGISSNTVAQTHANKLYQYIDEPEDIAGKLARKTEVESVLELWQRRIPGYDTEAAIIARLGL